MFCSHYEKVLLTLCKDFTLFKSMKSAKALVTLRRKTSKNEIFPAHPPFPCIRQHHIVNL